MAEDLPRALAATLDIGACASALPRSHMCPSAPRRARSGSGRSRAAREREKKLLGSTSDRYIPLCLSNSVSPLSAPRCAAHVDSHPHSPPFHFPPTDKKTRDAAEEWLNRFKTVDRVRPGQWAARPAASPLPARSPPPPSPFPATGQFYGGAGERAGES